MIARIPPQSSIYHPQRRLVLTVAFPSSSRDEEGFVDETSRRGELRSLKEIRGGFGVSASAGSRRLDDSRNYVLRFNYGDYSCDQMSMKKLDRYGGTGRGAYFDQGNDQVVIIITGETQSDTFCEGVAEDKWNQPPRKQPKC